MEVQTRSEETGLRTFDTLEEAFAYANVDPTVWKVSFPYGQERVRLVRRESEWLYRPLMAEVNEVISQR